MMVDASPTSEGDEADLLAQLRHGDETAFEELVQRYHMAMLRVARMYASDPQVAEEIVQESWIGVLRGIARFEGRSSLKTWIFSILINRAKTYAQREGRYLRQESLDEAPSDPGEPAVSAERFNPADHPTFPNHWAASGKPQSWVGLPEVRLELAETQAVIRQAIEHLPDQQREVITLRDIEGLSSEEVCNVLQISETNQRVLLHRARSRVRLALEQYLTPNG
jgi:RNA polymerase sigma-70 factor, ECF subfamily